MRKVGELWRTSDIRLASRPGSVVAAVPVAAVAWRSFHAVLLPWSRGVFRIGINSMLDFLGPHAEDWREVIRATRGP